MEHLQYWLPKPPLSVLSKLRQAAILFTLAICLTLLPKSIFLNLRTKFASVSSGTWRLIVDLYSRNANGVLRIKIHDPQLSVRIGESIITVDNDDQPIPIHDTKTHTIRVFYSKETSTNIFTAEVTLIRGEERLIDVTLLNGNVKMNSHALVPNNQLDGSNPPIKLVRRDVKITRDEKANAVTGNNEKKPAPTQLPVNVPRLVNPPMNDSRLSGNPNAGEMRELVPGMKFHWCPPGRFEMGSPTYEHDRIEDESQVPVTLTAGFWLGETEVTQEQWASIMNTVPWDGQQNAVLGLKYAASYISHGYPGNGSIEPDSAVEFCRRLTERELKASRLPVGWKYALPTEAQWEYACRAGESGRYHFGDDQARLNDFAWWGDNSTTQQFAHPVGLKLPNAWGLKDMHGNVWEWCQDNYRAVLPGGNDPVVVSAEVYRRVLRGGGFNVPAAFCRSAKRNYTDSNLRDSAIGFRVAVVALPVVVEKLPAVADKNVALRQDDEAKVKSPESESAPKPIPIQTEAKPAGIPIVNRPNFQAVYPPAKLKLIKGQSFGGNIPFRELNECYRENGALVIRSHTGFHSQKIDHLTTNQVIRAKIRIRNQMDGSVGLCLTQNGEANGVLVQIFGDKKTTLSPSPFAKNKPKTLQRQYDTRNVVKPVEEWNELICILKNKELQIFINQIQIDTVDLSTYSMTSVTIAFAINAFSKDTIVEIENYNIYATK